MRILFYFISILFLLNCIHQCDREMEVTAEQLQIDTVQNRFVSKKEYITGTVTPWADTVYASTAGKSRFIKKQGSKVRAQDTLLTIQRRGHINTKEHDGQQIKKMIKLHLKSESLNEYLQQILQSGNIEIISETTGSIVEYDEIIKTLLRENKIRLKTSKKNYTDKKYHEIEKFEKELNLKIDQIAQKAQKIESQLNNQGSKIITDYIKAPVPGEIEFLIPEGKKFLPGTPLLCIKNGKIPAYAIEVKNIPRGNWAQQVIVKSGNRQYEGQIEQLASGKSRVLITSNENTLLFEKNDRVQIVLKSKPVEKILINRTAIVSNDGQHWVFCRTGNQFQKVNIEMKPFTTSTIEILSGLHQNDQIIVSSSQSIWDKDRLKLTE